MRLGERSTPGLMKSMMHFRSKELNKRSAFPAREMGKRKLDAWNHDRVYVDRSVSGDGSTTSLAEFLLPMKITPLEGLTTSSIAVPDLFYLIITEVGMYFDNTN